MSFRFPIFLQCLYLGRESVLRAFFGNYQSSRVGEPVSPTSVECHGLSLGASWCTWSCGSRSSLEWTPTTTKPILSWRTRTRSPWRPVRPPNGKKRWTTRSVSWDPHFSKVEICQIEGSMMEKLYSKYRVPNFPPTDFNKKTFRFWVTWTFQA